MHTTGDIVLGQSHKVGEVQIDSTLLRGEGDLAQPRLVVPINLSLNPQQSGAQIGILSLTAQLSQNEVDFPTQRLGQPTSVSFLETVMPKTLSQAPSKDRIEVVLFLPTLIFDQIDHLKLSNRADTFALFLHVRLAVAWLRDPKKSPDRRGSKALQGVVPPATYGQVSEVLPFLDAKVRPVRLEIDKGVWAKKILSGVGYDRVRFLELRFPQGTQEGEKPTREFDDALQALNSGRFDDCIAKCRSIVNARRQMLGATKAEPVALRIAKLAQWPEADSRIAALDRVWQALTDIVNATHHVEDPTYQPMTDSDARFYLYLTALLIDYVGRLERRGT